MKAVILAGGFGTRIAEESDFRPKPMVEISGTPIIKHILDIYCSQGIKEFLILSGYKHDLLVDYFSSLRFRGPSVTFDYQRDSISVQPPLAIAPDSIQVLDTGYSSGTAGRLLAARNAIGEGDFFLTYGDGLANVDLVSVAADPESSDAWCTITAVRPPSRFARLEMGPKNQVRSFVEKPVDEGGWINGGFMCVNSKSIDLIENLEESFEEKILPKLASMGKLRAKSHFGYWQSMDTLRDKRLIESQILNRAKPPWLAL